MGCHIDNAITTNNEKDDVTIKSSKIAAKRLKINCRFITLKS